MKSKKIGVFVISLCLVILALGIISAESCDIRLKTECQTTPWNNTIMGLSDLTNAHGELWSQNNYDYVLCCDFARTHDCGTNKILGLSDVTNAHAEIPENSEYATPVCYGDFICRSGAITCNSDEMEILSLSDTTNAHVGSFGDYTTKICCDGICGTGAEYIEGNCVQVTETYWAALGNPGSIIYDIQVEIGKTTILMMLKNSGLSEGTEVDFKIYEKDLIFDDLITTKTGTIDSDGHANVSWTISQADIDATGEEDFEAFYFKVDGMASNELIITIIECQLINSCESYGDQDSCNGDACEVASSPLCDDDPLIDCWCAWDETDGVCNTLAGETTEKIYCGYCGDGMVNLSWEECDDGNHENEDGCSAGCRIEDAGKWCGDGIVNHDWEECDDGDNNDQDGCSAGCMIEDEGEWCGDGIINQAWEGCDDGNNGWNANNCSPTCQIQEISCDDIEIPSGAGTCSIIETTDDNCDDGFITYSWVGEWSGDPEGSLYEKCIAGGTRTVPCPAQIALPFFGVYNVILACIVVALVYVFLSIKKKKSKKA